MDDAVNFRPGTPSILEIGAKRSRLAQEAPKGRATTEVQSRLELYDDGVTVLASLTVELKGVIDGDSSEVFSAHCTVECKFASSQTVPPAELDNPIFCRMLCEPLYHRAAIQVQDLAWKMGYNAVRAPLMYPSEDHRVDEEPAPPKTRSRKTTANTTAKRPRSSKKMPE